MNDLEIIKISVRSLVEFILREGDIDNRMAGGTDKEAMQIMETYNRKAAEPLKNARNAARESLRPKPSVPSVT